MPYKILVVEDDAPIQEALSQNLRVSGYEVETAENGVDGLAAALASHPDLILLDYRMPKATGLQMLEQLRQDAWGRSAKVIFLSNEDDLDTVNGAMQFGVQDYVVKSDMSTDALLRLIAEKLA